MKNLNELFEKDEKNINVIFHPKDIDEFYILEGLYLLCEEYNLSEQEGLLEIMRMGVEEVYGMQRKSNNPIFHEKEYLEERKKRIENSPNGRIYGYELNKLKREFVEDRNDFI